MSEKEYSTASWKASLLGDAYHASFSPEDIEQQEKQGQQDLAKSSQLPKKCKDWDTLKKWGIEIDENETSRDELFYFVRLPSNWKIIESQNPVWSYLVDNKGYKRAEIFYKNSFYDKEAFIKLFRSRYSVVEDFFNADEFRFKVIDNCCVENSANTIFLGQPYCYAILKADPKVVGVLFEGLFYFDAHDESAHDGYPHASQFKRQVSAIQAKEITRKEFGEEFHNVERSNFETIRAAENLAREEADRVCEQLEAESGIAILFG